MIATSCSTQLQCYHCGQSLEAEPIYYEEKAFCCRGCQSVYQILSENNLLAYYSFEERNFARGIAQPKNEPYSDFSFLEDEKVLVRLLSFNSTNFTSSGK
ncbi:MAG: heavy metal translocating P-type ATPase metal-binding domain-containing protein [Bacteroidia bacterium]|nr:heavy metal translocating P-type ATPase metal-binding domain-containing protein [Bacteroidia bacterium]MDW8157635.1 heavy metal translocating P-type ATPase metal-binding domain-containing protein [Bacteroidia bacterium]